MEKLKKISTIIFSLFLIFSYSIASASLCNTNSAQFNGTSNYFTAADSTSLSITGDITIESWIRFDSTPSDEAYIYQKTNTAGNGNILGFRACDLGTLCIIFRDNSSNVTSQNTTSFTFSLNTWYHVAVSCVVATPLCTFYENGSAGTTGNPLHNATSINDSTGVESIGALAISPAIRFFPGKLDDVRVYNTARSGAAIAADYQQELNGNETNLQGYWKFDGSSLLDSTANHNDLTNVNSVTFSTNVPFVGTGCVVPVTKVPDVILIN